MTPIDELREALDPFEALYQQAMAFGHESGSTCQWRVSFDDLCKVHAALAILKDMEAQEPVAWMRIDKANVRKTKVFTNDIPLYAHPSPSAPVDIAEVIKAGDKMYEAMVRYQMDVDEDPPMKHRDMMEAWTDATAKHRTT